MEDMKVDLKQIISNNDSSYDVCVYVSEGKTLKSNESEMIISIIYFLHILWKKCSICVVRQQHKPNVDKGRDSHISDVC